MEKHVACVYEGIPKVLSANQEAASYDVSVEYSWAVQDFPVSLCSVESLRWEAFLSELCVKYEGMANY